MMNEIEDVFAAPSKQKKEASPKEVNNLSLGDISDNENVEKSAPKVNL